MPEPQLEYLDLARHTTLATGTGALSLSQVNGYPPPRLTPGCWYAYSIVAPEQRVYEVGLAPASAADLLDRPAGTVSLSSAGGAHVDLPPGPKAVVFGPLADTIQQIHTALALATTASGTAESAALAATAATEAATLAHDTATAAASAAAQAQSTADTALAGVATATTIADAALAAAQSATQTANEALVSGSAAEATAAAAHALAQDAHTQLVSKANTADVVASLGGVTGPIALQGTGGINVSVTNGQLTIDGSAVTGAVSNVNGQTGPVSLAIPTLPLVMSDVPGLVAALEAATGDLTLSPLHTDSILAIVGQLTLFDLANASGDLLCTFPATLVPNDRWGVCVVQEHATLGPALLLDANGHAPLVPADLSRYLLRTGDLLLFRALPHPTAGIAVLGEREHLGDKPPAIVYVDSSDPGFTPALPFTLQTGGGGYGNTVYFSNVAGGAQHGTWLLPPCRPGHYRLSASWFGDSNRTTNARYVISATGATTLTIASINQQATPTNFTHNGGSFRHLTDTFLHTLHGPITITVYNDAPGYLICDAIRAERLDVPW